MIRYEVRQFIITSSQSAFYFPLKSMKTNNEFFPLNKGDSVISRVYPLANWEIFIPLDWGTWVVTIHTPINYLRLYHEYKVQASSRVSTFLIRANKIDLHWTYSSIAWKHSTGKFNSINRSINMQNVNVQPCRYAHVYWPKIDKLQL